MISWTDVQTHRVELGLCSNSADLELRRMISRKSRYTRIERHSSLSLHAHQLVNNMCYQHISQVVGFLILIYTCSYRRHDSQTDG